MHETDSAVRVLGPLEVNGIRLRSPTARTVLAWLALHVGRAVRVDASARALWPGEESSGGARRVREAARSVSRKFPGLVRATATTLELTVAAAAVDDRRFRSLVGAGSTQRPDPSDLETALSLWRGEPYPDLATVIEARQPINGLVELRLATTEKYFALAVGADIDYEVVAKLRAAVLLHPLRERLWRQLAVGLFMTSRQTEALAQIEQCRRTLSTYGVPVSAALDALYLAILDGDITSARAIA